jgi:predicted nucleic acid-binding protein
MGLILDTDVIVASRRAGFDLRKTLSGYADLEVGIAAITAAELVRVVALSQDAARSRRRAFVEAFLASVPVLTFGLAEAREYARLDAELSTHPGRPSPHHLLVAATALTAGWALMTLSPADYAPVDGLVIAPID